MSIPDSPTKVKVMSDETAKRNRSGLKFILLIGVLSLFSDMTYEGARSVTGPFLALLGASAVVVGAVAGGGELLGYMLRIVSGYTADKTKRYWTVTIVGYVINLFAIPLLAFVGRWEVAAGLIILERIGKGIRTPARDAMLSHAVSQTGKGWGFGLHEAMDQTGAIIGPLIVAGMLSLKGNYQSSFVVLFIPAVLAVIVLFSARWLYPNPAELEVNKMEIESKGLPRTFWLYMIAIAVFALGFSHFSIIAYHFGKSGILSPEWIALFYSIAMGTDAVAALVMGRVYDRIGLRSLAVPVILSTISSPLVFLGNFNMALVGACLWGIGMGAQESVMRAAVADMAPSQRRGAAFGLFNTGFGVSWFIGGVVMGILYEVSISTLVIFSVALQLISVPIFWGLKKERA